MSTSPSAIGRMEAHLTNTILQSNSIGTQTPAMRLVLGYLLHEALAIFDSAVDQPDSVCSKAWALDGYAFPELNDTAECMR